MKFGKNSILTTILLGSIVVTYFLATSRYIALAQTPTETSTPTATPTSTAAPTPSTTPTPTSTSDSESSDKIENLQNQIREYEGKLSELQSQAKTLSSQIKIMDNQIKLTELRIAEIKQRITALQHDIGLIKEKVKGLEQKIDISTKVLLGRIVGVYAVGRIEPWQLFFASDNISNFLTRLKYLRIVQIYDKKNIYAAEQSKRDYNNQRDILEDKQTEEEVLRKKLEGYTTQLANEKKGKEDLLAVTKNSEREYQRRLEDALRELQQIQKAAKILITSEPRDVKRGEAIGLMGSTGYSFGSHLHFGVYNISSLEQYNYYASYENPASVLESKSVEWETECSGDPRGQTMTGSGSFSWPMSTDGLHISQGFGHTCYSDVYYRGNPHPAFDMYNKQDIVVRATEGGKAYFCRNCTGDGGNGVFILHPNGKMTLYWHLQ